MKEAVLCVDIGSSSLKAAYMGDTPKSIAYARASFSDTDSDTIAREWLPALKRAIDELKEKAPDTGIEAVCISGNGPTVVSDDGMTLLWSKQALSTVTDTKSMWVKRLDAYRKLHSHHWYNSKWILGAPEYLIYSLTGNAVTILPEERFTEIYWTEELLKKEGFSQEEIKKLPPFVKPGSLAGKVTQKAAEETGLLEGTLVFCGAPDFIVALIGTDTLDTGKMCDRSGSSEGINLCTPLPLEGENIRVMPSIIPGMWNASVVISDTGRRFADFKEKVEKEQNIQITHKNIVAQIVDWDKEETHLITEEQRQEGQAIIHDVTHQLWAALNILKKASAEKGLPFPRSMTITGGQALNEKWSQVKCDTLCFPMAVTECVDAELAGDNILARLSLGYYDSIEEAAFCLVKKAKVYTPATPADHA
jgi:xylulokinase